MTQSSQQKLLALAMVAIIALLGLSGFLVYNKINLDKLVKKQGAELIEETRIRADLEKTYYEALSDLEEMRSNNHELNAMIETQKLELKKQKDRIDGLISTSKELEKARTEIANLRKYVTEVEELRKKNAELQESNIKLTGERDQLAEQVEEERTAKEELSVAHTTLTAEQERLLQEKEALAGKVNKASAIKVSDISASGYEIKKSGKEAEKKKAKSIDGIKVCFKTTPNVIVADGTERFFIRVINPRGEVLAIQDLGSGMLRLGNSQETIQYTQFSDIDYKQEPVQVCINWQPGMVFEAGNYEVEVYNKGFLVGKATSVLK